MPHELQLQRLYQRCFLLRQNIQYSVSPRSVELFVHPTLSAYSKFIEVPPRFRQTEETSVACLRSHLGRHEDLSSNPQVQWAFLDIDDSLRRTTDTLADNFPGRTFDETLSSESGALTAKPINITCALL